MTIAPMYDRSALIGITLHTVNDKLLHGFVLIVAIVWLFLRSLRGSLIVAVIIPMSLLTAFRGSTCSGCQPTDLDGGDQELGSSGRRGGGAGQNVIHEAQVHRPQTRREVLKLVTRSAIDVARPTFYAMAIIIATLIPVFTLESVEGRIFRPLALTYSFALVGALVFSLTLVPALCAMAMRPRTRTSRSPGS